MCVCVCSLKSAKKLLDLDINAKGVTGIPRFFGKTLAE